MKVSQRLQLLDKIGRELQARYSYSDIDLFLAAYGVAPPTEPVTNSKWVYSKAALKGVDNKILLQIAIELEIDANTPEMKGITPPDIWADGLQFRLFLSHLAIHKDKAQRLKEALSVYHVAAFVAHQDITPTREWQIEIERALQTMDAMLAIHTKGFSNSVWTQQEVGFALGRGTKIMSLRLEEDPQGFISKHQAILRRGRNAEGVAEEIHTILLNDPMTKNRMAEVRSHHQKLEDDEIPF
jgi:hypothetical protein